MLFLILAAPIVAVGIILLILRWNFWRPRKLMPLSPQTLRDLADAKKADWAELGVEEKTQTEIPPEDE